MKIELKKITLRNFRGVSRTWEFSPGKNVFSGPNGSGKTTLFDAEVWGRTGKDSLGRSDFDLKSIIDGKQIEKSEHFVTAVYEIDGKPVELERVFFEKWSKKRGAAESTKSGNQTDYRIDGLEMGKREYETAIIDLFGPHYSTVSNISAVPNMQWKTRRELLMMLPPDVDPDKIIDSIPGFRDLLRDRTVEIAKKAADQRLKKVIKSGGGSLEDAEKQVSVCEKSVSDVQQKTIDAQSGDSAEAIEQLKKLNQSLLAATQELEEQRSNAQAAIDTNRREVDRFNRIEAQVKTDLAEKETEIADLRELYAKIRQSTAENVGDTCESCGQSLPQAKLDDRKENFMRHRAEDLEANAEQGAQLSGEIKKIKTELADVKSSLDLLKKFKSDHIQASTPEIDSIKSAIEKLKSVQVETPDFSEELKAAQDELTAAQEIRANVKATAGSVERIKELEAEKAKLSAENDKIQKFLSKHEEFNRAMSGAIEKPINDMFEMVNFRLFDTLENGNIVDVCDIMDKQGRPYVGALSNGEKVLAGLDIVSTLQKHFDVSVPVWIDNVERFTGEINLDCQFIELRADKNLKTLTQE